METTSIKIAVDSIEQATYLQNYLGHGQRKLEVWIEVNSGLNRCGVEPGEETLELAKQIMRLPNLQLRGLFTHAGHAYGASSIDKIEEIGQYEGLCVAESAELFGLEDRCEGNVTVNDRGLITRSIGYFELLRHDNL